VTVKSGKEKTFKLLKRENAWEKRDPAERKGKKQKKTEERGEVVPPFGGGKKKKKESGHIIGGNWNVSRGGDSKTGEGRGERPTGEEKPQKPKKERGFVKSNASGETLMYEKRGQRGKVTKEGGKKHTPN